MAVQKKKKLATMGEPSRFTPPASHSTLSTQKPKQRRHEGVARASDRRHFNVILECLAQKYLYFGALSWEQKAIPADKWPVGGFHIPTTTGYISGRRSLLFFTSKFL